MSIQLSSRVACSWPGHTYFVGCLPFVCAQRTHLWAVSPSSTSPTARPMTRRRLSGSSAMRLAHRTNQSRVVGVWDSRLLYKHNMTCTFNLKFVFELKCYFSCCLII